MKYLKIFVWLVLALSISLSSHAQDVKAKEAINYYNAGVKAQKDGDFEAAITAYQKTLILAPDNLTYQKFIVNNTGVIDMRNGEVDMAEKSFLTVLEMDSDYKPAIYNLGLIYDARGERIRSLEYWAKIFDLDSMKPKELVVEGVIKEDLGQ